MTMLKRIVAVLGIFGTMFVLALFAVAGYERQVGLFLVGMFMFLVLVLLARIANAVEALKPPVS